MTLFIPQVQAGQEAEISLAFQSSIEGLEIRCPSFAHDPQAFQTLYAQTLAAWRALSPPSATLRLEMPSDSTFQQKIEDLFDQGSAPYSRSWIWVKTLKSTQMTERDLYLFRPQPEARPFVLNYTIEPNQIDLFPEEFLQNLKEAGCAEINLQADSQRLLAVTSLVQLHRWGEVLRDASMKIGFSGKIEGPDVPRLDLLRPDVLIVPVKDFLSPLDFSTFKLLPRLLRRKKTFPGLSVKGVSENRGSLESCQKPEAAAESDPTENPDTPLSLYHEDRIFVRDIILPLYIGAYTYEQQKAQRLRFNVELDLLPPSTPERTIENIFSYDLITDIISLHSSAKAQIWIESLAENIAEDLLNFPQILAVHLQIEKLDLPYGRAGIDIKRKKQNNTLISTQP